MLQIGHQHIDNIPEYAGGGEGEGEGGIECDIWWEQFQSIRGQSPLYLVLEEDFIISIGSCLFIIPLAHYEGGPKFVKNKSWLVMRKHTLWP